MSAACSAELPGEDSALQICVLEVCLIEDSAVHQDIRQVGILKFAFATTVLMKSVPHSRPHEVNCQSR